MSATAAAAIEQALNVANLGTGTIKTTYVDKDQPHTFDSSTTGVDPIFNAPYSNFTTSGQLLIANAAPTIESVNGQVVITPAQITVTDSAGGNYFVTGLQPDNLLVNNAVGAPADNIFGSGTGETITLGTGAIVASGTGENASGHSTIIGGTDSATHYANTLWGGNGSDVLWGGGLSAVHAGNGEQVLNGGQWSNSADTLYTAAGNDTVNIWEGNNLIYGWNNDGLGNHWTDGHNTVWAGSGSDTILSGMNTDIHGVAVGDTLHSGVGVTEVVGATVAGAMSNIYAGENNMYIGLGMGNASIEGGTGKLFVWNGEGSDTVQLGSADDVVNLTNTGSSSIYGGTGNDTVNYWSSESNATVLGGANTTVNIVDQGTAVTGDVNKDGTITIKFGNHSLTVDDKVHLTWGNAANLSDFNTFKNNV